MGRRALRLLAIAAVVLVTGSSRDAVAADEPAVEAVAVFGTACARCHEGECSGRLSLGLDVEASTDHIVRHAGPVSKASIERLFGMLEYMKRECTYPPLDVPIPPDGVWSRAALARLCRPSRHSYFIPLGSLEPGRHSLELAFGNEPHVHAEVVTWTLELLIDQPLEIENRRATVEFQTPEASQPFLRLVAREPIELERLTLVGEEAPR
jgi:hypothetical protein